MEPKEYRILITAFEPFGGEKVNASQRVVEALPAYVGEWRIFRCVLPVAYGQGAEAAIREAEKHFVDAVLCVGQAAGRSKITPEMVAINLQYATLPDNGGQTPKDLPVVDGGPAAYFSTLPVRDMANAICGAGIPAAVSYSAGSYVCNDVMYRVLHHFAGTEVRAGFVHLPRLPEQGSPSLSYDEAVRGLICAVKAIDLQKRR